MSYETKLNFLNDENFPLTPWEVVNPHLTVSETKSYVIKKGTSN
jgi:hypothetical protein